MIARELLDNPDRAAKSQTWYLRDFLDRAIALAEGLPGGETLPEDQRAMAIYRQIGAVANAGDDAACRKAVMTWQAPHDPARFGGMIPLWRG